MVKAVRTSRVSPSLPEELGPPAELAAQARADAALEAERAWGREGWSIVETERKRLCAGQGEAAAK